VIERFIAAPLDRAALVRTAMTVTALVCMLILIFLLHQILPLVIFFAAPVLAMPALAYAGSPLGYALDHRALYVERKVLRTVRIPLDQIVAVRLVPRASLYGAMRVYGTGGLFGWAGRYRIRDVGTVSMQATNLERLIVIERRRRRPILISPADTNAFLAGLRRQFRTIEG
jgi:hypothetical protein